MRSLINAVPRYPTTLAVALHSSTAATIEEVLQRVEHETGVEGRRAFEGFLKKMHKTKEQQGG